MIRYTTPTITITVDDDLSAYSEIHVTFEQMGVMLDTTPSVDGNVLTVELSQEQTSMFNDKFPVSVMVNAYGNGKRYASDEMLISVKDNLLKRVIPDA